MIRNKKGFALIELMIVISIIAIIFAIANIRYQQSKTQQTQVMTQQEDRIMEKAIKPLVPQEETPTDEGERKIL
jgi:prepilin-type N-terminal cleavage/methylation domain-containing protein